MKLFRKLEVKIRYIIWAFKMLSYPTTYDKINYQGTLGVLTNGVNAPRWKTNITKNQIHQNTFLVIRGFKRDFRVFKQRYSFQMSSWYYIDYRNKLGSRISYYNSNDIRF